MGVKHSLFTGESSTDNGCVTQLCQLIDREVRSRGFGYGHLDSQYAIEIDDVGLWIARERGYRVRPTACVDVAVIPSSVAAEARMSKPDRVLLKLSVPRGDTTVVTPAVVILDSGRSDERSEGPLLPLDPMMWM